MRNVAKRALEAPCKCTLRRTICKDDARTSSSDATVCRHWPILATNVEVVGELKSSRVSLTNSFTLISPGIVIRGFAERRYVSDQRVSLRLEASSRGKMFDEKSLSKEATQCVWTVPGSILDTLNLLLLVFLEISGDQRSGLPFFFSASSWGQ